jgi:hypothetical protein
MGLLVGFYIVQLFIVALMLHTKDIKSLFWLGILLIPMSVYILTVLGIIFLIGMGIWHIFTEILPGLWKDIKELKKDIEELKKF